MRLCIDTKGYKQKPDRFDAGLICSRLATKETDVSLSELAEAIKKGKTWCPATYSDGIKKARNWVQQQVFCADIDNNNLSPEEILDKCSILKPAIIHHSFSSTPENRKYRVIFVFDKATTEAPLALAILKCIQVTLQCDPCVRDLARLFYAGKSDCIAYYDELAINSLNDFDFDKWLQKESSDNEYVTLSPLEKPNAKKAGTRKAKFAVNLVVAKMWDESLPRYMRVWHSARILAQTGCFTSEQIRSRIKMLQKRNTDFADWDKSADDIIDNAIGWSIKTADEESE